MRLFFQLDDAYTCFCPKGTFFSVSRPLGLSEHAGETSATVSLTNQDFLITVEDEAPPQAPPTPKQEGPRKKKVNITAYVTT